MLATVVLVAMAGGWMRVDGEWPGLLAGGLLVAVFVLVLRRT